MPFLHLLRHGKAESASTHPQRPLSHYGLRQVKSTADLARKGGYVEQPREILHSPKVRAKETAEKIAAALGWTCPLRELADLDPEAEPESVLDEIQAQQGTLMLVGHLPFLPRLASLLIPQEHFRFGEAEWHCFEKVKGIWREAWNVEPRPPDPRKGE